MDDTFSYDLGLDLNVKDGNGRTIVEVAREIGNQTIEKLLKEKCEKWLF